MLVSGEALVMPGFCFIRVVDFLCYMWLEAQHIPPDIHANTTAPLYPEVSYNPDYYENANYSSYYDYGDYSSYGGDDYAGWGDYSSDYFNMEFTEKIVASFISLYLYPVLLLFGTFGNILCFAVLTRLSREVLSSCVYLGLLAILDLLQLYTHCGNRWLTEACHMDISNMLLVTSSSICKVYPFVFSFVFHLSRWLMVCIAIEGTLATSLPHQIPQYCSLSRAKAVVLLLVVLLVCLNIHFFWSFELVHSKDTSDPAGRFCKFQDQGYSHHELFRDVLWPLTELVVAEVLPFAIVSLCGVVMLYQICSKRYQGNAAHQEWRKRYQMNPEAVDELRVVICVICLLFPVLCLPKFFSLVYRYILEKHEIVEYSFRLESQQVLAQTICSFLEYLFLSCGKFLVYVSASKTFRANLSDVVLRQMCCRRKRREKNVVTARENKNPLLGTSRSEERFVQEWDRESFRYKYYQDAASNIDPGHKGSKYTAKVHHKNIV